MATMTGFMGSDMNLITKNLILEVKAEIKKRVMAELEKEADAIAEETAKRYLSAVIRVDNRADSLMRSEVTVQFNVKEKVLVSD